MTAVRIWALGPFYDTKTVKSLPGKLAQHLQLADLSIRASCRRALPSLNGKGESLSDALRRGTQNYLKQEDSVIFLTDDNGSMSADSRWHEPKSLVNQIERIVSDIRFEGRVSLARTERELEGLLLCKSLAGPSTTGWEEWHQIAAPFHKAFADTPEDEVLRDLEAALAEVRREQS